MGEYCPLEIVTPDWGTPGVADSAESRTVQIYQKLKPFSTGRLSNYVTSVQFFRLPGPKGDKIPSCLIAGGTRVEMLDLNSKVIVKSYTAIKDIVRCVTSRSDGKLFAVSDDSGLVQVIDSDKRTCLRRFKGHNGPVYSCNFDPKKTHLMSAGDDTTMKYWDLSLGECIQTLPAHSDSIRQVGVAPSNPNMWSTCSNDGYVKFWDIRQNSKEAIMKLSHPETAESFSFFSRGNLIATAAGNKVYIWDIIAGGLLLATLPQHLKNITAVAMTPCSECIISASLDHTVKYTSTASFEVEHTVNMPSEVTSLSALPDGRGFVAGMSDGRWVVRSRSDFPPGREWHSEAQVVMHKGRRSESRKLPALGSLRYFKRGKHEGPALGDTVVSNFVPLKNSRLDKLLRSFQYQAALDLCLAISAAHVISLIDELIERGALDTALRGYDEVSIQPLLQFVSKNIGRNATYTRCCGEAMHTLCEVCAWLYTSEDVEVMGLLSRISQKLAFELSQQSQLMTMQGMLDSILDG